MAIIDKHIKFLYSPSKANQLEGLQEYFINTCMQLIKLQEPYALQGSRYRWDASLGLMKTRDPYCFENFTKSLTWVPGYVKCIQSCGINWLGSRFKFPIIWFPDKKYKNRYMLTKKVEKAMLGGANFL